MKDLLRAIIVVLVLSSAPWTAVAQPKTRTVKEVPLHRNSPIVIVSRELGNEALDKENRALGYQDWLKDLRFEVKNISSKNIYYFNIDLMIFERAKMPSNIIIGMEFRAPMLPNTKFSGQVGDLRNRRFLGSGEVVKVGISDDDYSYWTQQLRKYEAEDVEDIRLDIRTVYFADGTGWSVGVDLQHSHRTLQRGCRYKHYTSIELPHREKKIDF